MSRTSSRNIAPQHQKYSSTHVIVHMGYFLSMCSPNPYWVYFFKGFLTQRLNYFLQFSSCCWRVLNHSNSLSHCALGRYRHTSSSRQCRYILCWLEILNYCPDGGNGYFHGSSSFLQATSLISEAQLSFAAHQKYIIWFFSLWWMIKGIWVLISLFIFLWNRKPWLDIVMFIITKMLKIVNMNGNILQRYFTRRNF